MSSSERPGLFEKKDILWAVLFLLLLIAVFRDFFLADRMIFERDTTVIEVPARKLTVQLIHEGHFALWTDAYGGGQAFFANPKNAVLYPATLLYLLLPLFTAFKLFYLLHVLIGWLGIYYLGKAYALTRRSAFLGACVFAFGGMYLSSFEFYNHIAAMAWMPWVLVALKAGPKRPLPKIALLAALWSLMILSGSPEFVLITAVLCAALAFSRPGRWKKELATTSLSLVLACFLSAVQLLPSLDLLSQTGRENGTAFWPLELLQLPNLVFPGILGNDREPGHSDFWGWHLFDQKFPLYYSLYIGFGAVILSLLALRRPRDRVRLALAVTGLGFFLVSCGRYSPFFFIHRALPVLSSIRYPVKFFLGSVFCLSFLAAAGFDDLAKGRIPGKRFVRLIIFAAVIPSAVFWPFKNLVLALLNKLFIIDLGSSMTELTQAIGIGLALLAAYAAILLIASRWENRVPLLTWLILFIAVIDPAYHNRFVNPTVPTSFFDKSPLLGELGVPLVIEREGFTAPFLKETISDNVLLLRYFQKSLYPFTAEGDGVRYVFNVDFYGTYPRVYHEKVEAVKKLPPEIQRKVLTSLGCNYRIGGEALYAAAGAKKLVIEGQPVFLEKVYPGTITPFIPRTVLRARSTNEALKLFAQGAFDPLRDAIVRDGVADPGLGTGEKGPSGRIIALEEAQGYGRYMTVLDKDGIVVFPGNNAPGWRALIDGRAAEVFEANLFSNGVPVPAGEHEVIVRYRPSSFILGVWITLITALALAGVSIKAAVRAKRTGRPVRP